MFHVKPFGTIGGLEVQRVDRTINLCESRDESWLWIWRAKKKFVW
jgi:hypothetical protein